MAFRVFIDPGHGGTDPGAVHNGRQEKDDVLRLALAVGRILEDNGVDVVYSRTEDFYDSPYEKAMKGNESEADLFLSLHRNAAALPGSGTGADLLVYADTGFASDVANQIGEAVASTGFQVNGITERPNLAVLRRTKMPAVLVEAGFIDNENDNRFFDENFDALAESIAWGILNTFDQDTGFDTASAAEARTDHPENQAMNTDAASAFADADPAQLLQKDESSSEASAPGTSDLSTSLSQQDFTGTQNRNNRNPDDSRCSNCGDDEHDPENQRWNNDRNNSSRNQDDWRDRDDWRNRDDWRDRDDWRNRGDWRDRDSWRGRDDWRNRDDWRGRDDWRNRDDWRGRDDRRDRDDRQIEWFGGLDISSNHGNQRPTDENTTRIPDYSGNSNGSANTGRPVVPGSPGRPSGPESPGRPDRPGMPGNPGPRLFRVQVGAFTNPMFATQLLNQLLLEGFPAFVVFSDGLYRVQVGAFSVLENAVRMERRLRNQGYQTYITT